MYSLRGTVTLTMLDGSSQMVHSSVRRLTPQEAAERVVQYLSSLRLADLVGKRDAGRGLVSFAASNSPTYDFYLVEELSGKNPRSEADRVAFVESVMSFFQRTNTFAEVVGTSA